MITVGHSTLKNIAGVIWIGIGVRLFSIGLMLLNAKIIGTLSNINVFLPVFWTACCLLAGYLKGHFVLRKSVVQNLQRIAALPPQAPIYSLYTKKQVILIAFMMLLGISMKYLPLPVLLRSSVDIAVGVALLYGGACYFTIKNV